MKDAFSRLHPVVNFLYFTLIIGFTMFYMHPFCLAASFIGAVSYAVYLKGFAKLRRGLLWLVPMMLLTATVNPAFNHEGATILAYLPSGNPLTLESILYGAASAMLLASAVMWFVCCTEVMTSDKFIYLFGRVIPSLSLVLSMTLRFVPRFTAHMKSSAEAHACIAYNVSTGNKFKLITSRLRNAVKILSATVTWSMENAVDTADSMKSRGWGLPGRGSFSLYRFGERDIYALVWLLFCGMYVLTGSLSGGLYARYFPTYKTVGIGAFPVSFMLMYLSLCFTPLFIDLTEDRKWK